MYECKGSAARNSTHMVLAKLMCKRGVHVRAFAIATGTRL